MQVLERILIKDEPDVEKKATKMKVCFIRINRVSNCLRSHSHSDFASFVA
jgi:hypothetical protein